MSAALDAQAHRATAALHHSAETVDPFTSLYDLRRVERRRGRAQVVAVGHGALWVANRGDGTVSRVDLATDRVVATVPVGDAADVVAAGPDAVWVGGWSRRAGNTVSRVDPLTNRVVATVPLTSEPYGLAVTGDAVWATELVAGTVTRIDPSSNRVVATIRTGGRPVHVAADERSVWVAYPLDTLVRRIDPLTNTVDGTVRVAQPQGVAIGFGSVWVPSQRAREVLRFDPRAGLTTAGAAGRIPVAGEPAFIAVGRSAVWVGGHDRTVQRIDPATGTVTASRPVAGALHAMAVDEVSLWTASSVGDTVSRARLPE